MSVVAKRLDGLRYHLVWRVGIGPGDFVFDGDPALSRKKGTTTSSNFLAHVYCGQTAGWIKVPLGMEVNLGPADVFDEVAAPP